MTTAWAYQPDMHPWFRQPSLKRSLSDSDEDADPSHLPKPTRPLPKAAGERVKRRRCDALERGLSQLTLSNTNNPSPFPAPIVTGPDAPAREATAHVHAPGLTITPLPSPPIQPQGAWGRAHAPLSASPQYTNPSFVLPGSVEEPTSPASAHLSRYVDEQPDVAMRGPSWYEIEKDRIVITELEDSDTETEDGAEVIVSPALLEHIRRQTNGLPSWKEPSDPNASKALVLFQPVIKPDVETSHHPFAPPTSSSGSPEIVEVTPGARLEQVQDDDIDVDIDVDVAEDAMDVEPMDVEL